MSIQPPLEVLVVDRDAQSRSDTARCLSEQGYHATELADPAQAADAVRRRRHHMVLLDVSDAAGEGLRWLREIRGCDGELCVICTTDRPEVETAVAIMKQRAFDYLVKPFSSEALSAVLRAAAEQHNLAADLEQRLNREIGARIRARRHDLDLTLKQVARRTGLSISLISQVELGKSAASLFTLYKLATALRVPLSAFFQEAAELGASRPAPSTPSQPAAAVG
jgi:DNA-binding NtrC family response regulator